MIPEFPKFTKLSLKHKNHIESFCSEFEPYSDFNFTSLFCWDVSGSTEVSILNENLVIKICDYITGEPIHSILGKKRIDDSVSALLQVKHFLKLVPEIVIQNIKNPHNFDIQEDRDNFDYIVSIQELSELKEEDFPKKKKQIEIYKQINSHIDVRSLDPSDPKTSEVILKVFNSWAQNSNKKHEETKNELEAIKRLLINNKQLNEQMVLSVFEGEEPAGFNVYEVSIHGKTLYGISAFQKASQRKEGQYAFITHELAKSLNSAGVEFANFEQDLGIEGLRNSKLSYHPKKFLKKYTIKGFR